jgi:mono/diheme cytochrome c family protein
VRPLIVLTATVLAGLSFTACGSEGISVPEDDPSYAGAVLFAERCSGCHTLAAAGSQGSGNRALRAQGPNFDERTERFEDVMYAIQNGGFSGAIMPQNIVVGDDAVAVSRFLAEYAGSEVDDPPRPTEPGAAGVDSATEGDERPGDAETGPPSEEAPPPGGSSPDDEAPSPAGQP